MPFLRNADARTEQVIGTCDAFSKRLLSPRNRLARMHRRHETPVHEFLDGWQAIDADLTATYRIVAKNLHLALKLAGQAKTDLGFLKSTSQFVDPAITDPRVTSRWMRAGCVLTTASNAHP